VENKICGPGIGTKSPQMHPPRSKVVYNDGSVYYGSSGSGIDFDNQHCRDWPHFHKTIRNHMKLGAFDRMQPREKVQVKCVAVLQIRKMPGFT
jgi:hypothetical protein